MYFSLPETREKIKIINYDPFNTLTHKLSQTEENRQFICGESMF